MQREPEFRLWSVRRMLIAGLTLLVVSSPAFAKGPLRLDPPPPKPPRLDIKPDPRLFSLGEQNSAAINVTSSDIDGESASTAPSASLSIDDDSAVSTRIVAADRKDDRDWALKSPYDYSSSKVTNLMDDVGLDELRIEMKARF